MQKVILLYILSLLTLLNAQGQQKPLLDSLISKFDKYRRQAIQEKIYAHVDRNLYLTGETSWFKIYVMDASFQKPVDLSKVAYVEILNAENKSVLQAKIELVEGKGNGSFFLPVSLSSGHYTFRCYTAWMKNLSPDFYFHKKIAIINPFVKAEDVKIKPSPVQATFFPEGGNLVADLTSKVAFKLSDGSGKGLDGMVFITNQNNDTVISAKPLKFGIGNFYFRPRAGQHYRAYVKDEKGKISKHHFPETQQAGYVMALNDTAQYIAVNVYRQPIDTIHSLLYLFVHARQIITKTEAKVFTQDRSVFMVNKKDLQEGISHFTIFNESLQPVCERLYFKIPETKSLDIEVTTDQKEYGQRRKITLELQTRTGSQKTGVPANLSIAVYKLDSLTANKAGNIFHHTWLSADLKGWIESPEYYFDPKNTDVSVAADNLMLTHGWRRFKWDEVFNNKHIDKYAPEYRGHIIKATINHKTDSAARGIVTYLSIPSKNVRLYGSRSNAQHEALYEVKDFYGLKRIIIQPALQDNAYEVKIQYPFASEYASTISPPIELVPEAHRQFLLRSIAMQVQDIYYYDTLVAHSIKPHIDSLPFYGKASKIYSLDDFTRFQQLEDVMREYVPEVFVRKKKDGFHFILLDVIKGGVLNGDPLVLLDGLPIFDVNKVMTLDPLKIQRLEVLNRKYYHGISTFHGIVSFSTYIGDLNGFEPSPNSVALNYEGLQVKREFYSPVYETLKDLNNTLPDQRYLLLWKPDVTTGKAGTQKLEFYTSDVTGSFIIVTEGLTPNGYAGSHNQIFSVHRRDN